MNSSRSSMASPSIPFKSKKPLQSTPKSKSAAAANPITTQTPDKPPVGLSSRLRNSRVALTVKEVRRVAQGTRDPPLSNQTDQIVKSARRQISSWPEESSTCKSHRQRNATVDEGSAKIPAEYEMLGEFFDSLDSTIRLLRLKGSTSTFTNISPKIECLTDRRFSHRHLAQLKYILPEAIEIKRVLMFDERTSCMKPDLHVTVDVDAIESDENLKSESNKNLHLRKVFRARLADFYKAHPEGDEIPEAMLPEPFNRSKQPAVESNTLETNVNVGHGSNSSSPVETGTLEKHQPAAVASHLSQSFKKRFSQKVAKSESENACIYSPMTCSRQSISPVLEETSLSEPSLITVSSELTDGNKDSTFCNSSIGEPMACLLATPCKDMDSINCRDSSAEEIASFQSTPAKLASTPAALKSATPALRPPKRCYMSPDEDSSSLADKLVRRPPRARSLNFETPVKNVKNELNGMENVSADNHDDDDDDDDILNILPESLLQSIREKERKVQEERDPAISLAKRRRQMVACLPKLFNVIHFLFQSINRSVITKEELIHKIIAGHSDIVDRREVEEQLKLLLELVPEWISEKSASSGDLLFCINKMSSAENIRSRLEEAK
ncbi:hypothetical protein JCGZ_17709 [Jatropha curcas]|uniref:CDT1 Geminin-binding domain-containing protein n=1 Tax=Jatropha curcas TaxID=180498 RepID=A0A067JRG9_JATCU|nr:CDT1-like protein a, chloroplastic [Jatropha curcas]KDP26551.1 hypothetical protein JCGZ_17709 [Jatropha curcas]